MAAFSDLKPRSPPRDRLKTAYLPFKQENGLGQWRRGGDQVVQTLIFQGVCVHIVIQ
jgi:hypothetical protein